MATTDRERIKKYYEYLFNMNNGKPYYTIAPSAWLLSLERMQGLPVLKALMEIGTPEIVDDEECPTAAIGINAGHIIYQFGRNFYDQSINSKTTYGKIRYSSYPKYPTIVFIAMHEVLHYILAHISGRGDGKNHMVWNIATDMVINELLIRANLDNIMEIPKNIILAKDFKINKIAKKSSEEVYEELMEKMENLAQIQNVIQEAQGRIAATGSHDNWNDLEGKTPNAEEAGEIYKEIINRNESQDWGVIAGNAISYINVHKEKNIPWDKILFETLASHIIGVVQTEEQWAPPNRRLQNYYPNIILPSEHNRIDESKLLRLMVAIDCSGSISDALLQKLANAVCSLPEDKIHEPIIVCFDTRVYRMDYNDFKNNKSVKFTGRGGTEFQPIYAWANQHEQREKSKIDQIVVLTDGYASRPSIPYAQQHKWVWVITPNGTTHAATGIGKIIQVNKI